MSQLNSRLLLIKLSVVQSFSPSLFCLIPLISRLYDDFHEHLDGQNADIQLTKEIEENGITLFLDCLVTHDNNRLRTTNYRKPTHTDRLLDQSSFNPTSHKATTIRTLTRRAQLVCDSPDSLQDETDYLNNVFSKKLQRRLC